MSGIDRSPATRLFAGLVVLLALGTALALVLLWPGDVEPKLGAGIATKSERAKVERIEEFRCSGFATDRCRRATVRLESGADKGKTTKLELGVGGLNPDLGVGDVVRVAKNAVAPGADPATAGYTLTDFERRGSLLLLALVFAALVIAFGRLRGALSLAGLVLSLAVLLVFVVPAILDGTEPLLVALVGSFAVMLTTIGLAHGVGPKSLAAILGTAASLLLTVGLALLFADLASLTGLSSEEAAFLQVNESGVDLRGLLLAGMVIGALGVLDDVTISQASTVLALRAANPGLGAGELFRRALRVGRDHVTATVNTLVLAYVGASLPLLLIFSSGELGFVETVSIELIAKEVVATLVGSIGLIAAVPITTALAAVLSVRLDPGALAVEAGHAH
jgi:uncharacterized membrane protein